MNKKRILLIIICIVLTSVLGGVFFPLLLDKFIFSNNYPSALSNSDWSGFLGGIWGGIIGGIGTLIAVCITTLDTRDIQKESKQQIIAANYKDKLQSSINALCSYWEKNTNVLKVLQEINNCKEEIISADKEIDSICNDLSFSSLTKDNKKVLIEKKEALICTKVSKTTKIEKLIEKKNHIIDSTSYEYLLLKLLLSDIKCASCLSSLINDNQTLLTDIQQSKNIDILQLSSSNHLLQQTAKEFIQEFEKQFIKTDIE